VTARESASGELAVVTNTPEHELTDHEWPPGLSAEVMAAMLERGIVPLA
jgi:hypothetical protein